MPSRLLRPPARLRRESGEFADELFVRLDLAGAVPYDEAIGIIPAGNQQEGEIFVASLTDE
jgi:hypothetical protein